MVLNCCPSLQPHSQFVIKSFQFYFQNWVSGARKMQVNMSATQARRLEFGLWRLEFGLRTSQMEGKNWFLKVSSDFHIYTVHAFFPNNNNKQHHPVSEPNLCPELPLMSPWSESSMSPLRDYSSPIPPSASPSVLPQRLCNMSSRAYLSQSESGHRTQTGGPDFQKNINCKRRCFIFHILQLKKHKQQKAKPPFLLYHFASSSLFSLICKGRKSPCYSGRTQSQPHAPLTNKTNNIDLIERDLSSPLIWLALNQWDKKEVSSL